MAAFVPSVSLHAAVRSAQARGEAASTRSMIDDLVARKRAQRHLLRVFKTSTPYAKMNDVTGVWANAKRTWALVICDGIMVTAISAAGREHPLGDGKLSSLFKRLVKRRFALDDAAILQLEKIE